LTANGEWEQVVAETRALVIGGTGTISRAIVRSLRKRGADVTVFNRGVRQAVLPEGVAYLTGDRTDRPAFEARMRDREFDVVYDVISFFPDDAASAIRAFRDNVGHFIHVSTVMTYGPPFDGDGVGLDESSPLNGAVDGGYGTGKVAADSLILEAVRDFGFPATIVKPSLTFGEGRYLLRQADWWPGWVQRVREGREIISVGDGTNLFQYLPAQSMGEALARIAERRDAIGEVYNIVNPRALSWDHWIRTVASVLDVEANIVHVPRDMLVAANPERFGRLDANFAHTQVFNAAKVQALLPDWQPVPITEGIEDALEWMDEFIPDSGNDPEWAEEDKIIEAMTEFTGALKTRLSA
jgi:nucleoside-diphosphate-sugar epimerase